MSVGLGVAVAVGFGVAVAVGLGVAVAVAVGFGVAVAVGLGVAVAVGLGVAVGFGFGDIAGFGEAVGFGVTAGFSDDPLPKRRRKNPKNPPDFRFSAGVGLGVEVAALAGSARRMGSSPLFGRAACVCSGEGEAAGSPGVTVICARAGTAQNTKTRGNFFMGRKGNTHSRALLMGQAGGSSFWVDNPQPKPNLVF